MTDPERPVATGLAFAGRGITAEVDGEAVAVGNARMLADQGIAHDIASVAATEAHWSAQGAPLRLSLLFMQCLSSDTPPLT